MPAPALQLALPVPLPTLFDYAPPPGHVAGPGDVGRRLRVPFGAREMVGIVAGLASVAPESPLREADGFLDDQPVLSGELWDSLHWLARYLHAPLGEVLATALPAALRRGEPLPDIADHGWRLTEAGHTALPGLRAGAPQQLAAWLQAQGESSELQLDIAQPGWRAPMRNLRKRTLVEQIDIQAPPVPVTQAGPTLNPAQRLAADAIRAADGYAPFLLDGVTGSGKTEVYLASIAETLRQGRQALVLVPEIALTPQTTRRFRERLGFDVAILHSGLGEGERAAAWLAAARGEARVVLGTRSAIFVPLPNAGLIIVDEEHDASYKQQDGFRYHARDLAVVRARALGVPLILGSATPSLESLANAQARRYRLLRLSQRAGVAKPPSLQIMDLRRKRLDQGLAISTLAAIEACLGRGEQVLVFRNRRGYAPVLFCHACGWSAHCTRCDRPLTLHRGAARLRCHHCGAEERVPSACPACASTALAPQGQGTERLEEVLQQRFPQVPVVRVDRDSTRSRGGRDAIFDQLDVAGPRILVGTQMLAKGHDLPNLTLVVVTGVDQGLYSVDFRAAERLGQLIVQVAGRAGRAERPGAVILQTHHPEHPLLHALISGGYPALAAGLLGERRAAGLPPFASFSLLRAESRAAEDVAAFLQAAVDAARASQPAIVVHGPLPAPMPRRAGYQRSQVLIEAAERATMQAFLPDWLTTLRALKHARRVRWSIDVDPVEMG